MLRNILLHVGLMGAVTLGAIALPATFSTAAPADAPNPSAAPAPDRPAPATPARRSSLYNPIPITSSNEITDTLTTGDIPTGSGGFSRDYLVSLKEGDQLAIDLSSEQFDTILILIGPDGATVAENDDGPDGTTNSLLFARIAKTGDYIVRVSPYSGQGTGAFKLKVTRLRPAS
jgi:hypothetical protein